VISISPHIQELKKEPSTYYIPKKCILLMLCTGIINKFRFCKCIGINVDREKDWGGKTFKYVIFNGPQEVAHNSNPS
jgi:hypothetical protein